ncbi:uncharacterized protein zgc:193726 isoform X13 [Xyrauchen texanus]|uniref:uncharacterized protein zgc:193726 isoform X12 n=1 Tax=Xyrauchen texanus TaxID=154827 RepID=UPI0022420631|nr:uncharacterized protein zgc:193726 isoform X12 [Xyrauchen texanus]XP_051974681.1 uncharacterized protein zgc:193726 isoform X13 [Xyrauchen texanus]
MDTMLLVWTLSFLLLSYSIGVPILNMTSGSDKESSLNATEIDQIGNANNYNSTVPLNRTSGRQKASQRFCLLSTCALSKLGYSLQRGDETAGNMSDPMGIGKK